jgi:sec-independent protein translocase protein TatA
MSHIFNSVSQLQLAGFMGGYEWILIAAVVLLLFGGKKIPELMKGLGGGIKEFKKATKDEEDKEQDKLDDKK